MSDRCVLRHDRPTTARAGLLCIGHSRRILTTLQQLVDDWALLDDVREPGTVDSINVRGGPIDPGAPVRLEVIVVRDLRTIAIEPSDPLPILAIIESWARMVREERHLATPPHHATIVSEVGTLQTHHDWITQQLWVDDYAAELRASAACLRGILGIRPPATVGHCPISDEAGNICGGRLHQDHFGMGVSCSKCHAHWDPDHLRWLGQLLNDTQAVAQ